MAVLEAVDGQRDFFLLSPRLLPSRFMDSAEDLALLQRIDAAATEFEQQLKAGGDKLLESFVDAFEPGHRVRAFQSLLELEVDYRQKSGEPPKFNELIRRFPDFEKEIREVLSGSGSNTEHPKQIGPYQLRERLGQGGMGTVYKAWHTKLRKTVAIKVLPSALANSDSAVARFDREMEAIGRLSHPNIIAARDADQRDGIHYLVMDCFEGVDVARLSKHIGKIGYRDAAEIVRQACLGLTHAHEKGLVHRDLKPSNLFLGADGVVRILDMGLARLACGQTEELTATGQIMGTADYMAPEQMESSHEVDIRADIYSLGATLYRLVTGTVPFPTANYSTLVGKLLAQSQEPPPSLRGINDVPSDLADICDRMLQPKPDDRFGSPEEVAEALVEFASGANLTRFFERKETARSQPPKSASKGAAKPASNDVVDKPQVVRPASEKTPSVEGPASSRRATLLVGIGLLAVSLVAFAIWGAGLFSGLGNIEVGSPAAEGPQTTGPLVSLDRDQPTSESIVSIAHERLVAEEVLSNVSGNLRFILRVGDELLGYEAGSELPTEPFEIYGATIQEDNIAPILDQLLACQSLVELDLTFGCIQGLQRLSEFAKLRKLTVSTEVTGPEDYSFVSDLKRIESLAFRNPVGAVPQQFIDEVTKLSGLSLLRVESRDLSSDQLNALASMTGLTGFALVTESASLKTENCDCLRSLRILRTSNFVFQS